MLPSNLTITFDDRARGLPVISTTGPLLSRPWNYGIAVLAICAVMLVTGAARASPALVFDASSGHVLYEEDAHDLWHPASVTKVMTAYLVFEAIKQGKLTLESRIVQSELSHAQPPSKIGLPVGGEMTVETGLRALIVKSANDVAVMLAEGMAGSTEAFVDAMNAKAAELGMSRTKFINPNGLPAPDQVSTAYDLARLSVAVMRDFPQYAELWAQEELRLGRVRMRSHNRLLKSYEGTDGLKTGFTCDSGFNVVASATRNGRRLVAVVLGSPSGWERNQRAANLLEHGFQFAPWAEHLSLRRVAAVIPPASASNTPVSVRRSVTGFQCGRPRPRNVAKTKRPSQKKATQVKAPATSKATSKSEARPQGKAAERASAPPPPAEVKAAGAEAAAPAKKQP